MKDISSSLPVVVITGGSLGIGAATAGEFLLRNWRVAILDITPLPKHHPAHEVSPQRVLFMQTDITKEAQVKKAFKKIYASWKRIDTLINNAGIAQVKPFEKTTPQEWNHIYNVNVMGTLLVTHASLPYLKKQDRSQIITIASGAANHGIKDLSLYGMSKAALVNFSQALHAELGKYNISVCAITPGSTDTPLFRKAFPGQTPIHTPVYVARIIADVAEHIIHPNADRIVDTFYHRHQDKHTSDNT